MSTATIEMPVIDPVHDLIVLPVPESDDDGATDPVAKKVAKLEAKRKKLEDRCVTAALDVYDGPDVFKKHLVSGERFDDLVRTCKESIYTAWVSDDYGKEVTKVKERIAIVSAARPRLEDDHKALLFCRAFEGVVDRVRELKWSYVLYVLEPACMKLDRKELVSKVADGWFDFMVELILRLLSDNPPKLTDVKETVALHTAKVEADANASLTEEKRAQKVHAAAVAEMNKKKSAGRSSLTKGVAKALEGHTPLEVGAILQESGLVLPQLGPNPSKMTALEAKQFVALLSQAKNWVAIIVLYKELGTLVAEYKGATAAINAIVETHASEQAATIPVPAAA